MLFSEVVYGPIRSRRLGVSLGVNVMPLANKLCTFDCVYCECGFNQKVSHPVLPTVGEFRTAMQSKLSSAEIGKIDVITFSGNGEPTLHPQFKQIMECCVELRDRYCPSTQISVLSNSTQLYRQDVREALMMADRRILKLDSAIDDTMHLIDQPVNKDLTCRTIIDYLKMFDGDFTLQTCFLKGTHNSLPIDNTTNEELSAWYEAVDLLRPQEIMIYVIDRQTPVETLEKIPKERMQQIARPLIEQGYRVIISA